MEHGAIGWHFPPTNGGLGHSFNDPGIAHFRGSPYSSLARETIQNSLDARTSSGQPVDVTFEKIELLPDEMGRTELSAAFDACMSEIDPEDLARPKLVRAWKVLARDRIAVLRVSDGNITGLRDRQWRTLARCSARVSRRNLRVRVAPMESGNTHRSPFQRCAQCSIGHAMRTVDQTLSGFKASAS